MRNTVGNLILILLGLLALQGLQTEPEPTKAASPASKRAPVLPWRRPAELAEQQLQEPIAHLDPQARRWVTTGFRPFAGQAKVGGTTSPDGAEEIAVDLPREHHLQNRGGTDGAGLCVFCSIQHAAVWQHVRSCEEIFRWMWTKAGGGWPERVDKLLPQIAAEKGAPTPDYLQVQSKDLEILRLAAKTGRMPGVTYNFSPTGRYGGRKIAHMVSLVHASERWFAILDNNFPGTVEWMDPQTFLRVYAGGGNGWTFLFLSPGPPPPPRNLL